MLSLEIIAVLGFIYCFFMFAMLMTQRAEREIRERPKIREIRLAPAKPARGKPAPASTATTSEA